MPPVKFSGRSSSPMRMSRANSFFHRSSLSMTCTKPPRMLNSTWKYGKLGGMDPRRPLGGAVEMHFLASCVLHSLSASSIAFLKYMGACSATSSGSGMHSTVACLPIAVPTAPAPPRRTTVSMKQHSLPCAANILTRHFLKLRISSNTSSSTARDDAACAMGEMMQCPGTKRPDGGSIRYARLPYAMCRCLGRAGESRQYVHLLCAAWVRL
mmetsp:Transcript_34920/g.85550  ORF Transcript_34920/g.85550 Transcript_34920/m.85550 type:complete len:211 (+) Transcript_34920:941-1573(+)